ncbi:hypothetical protein Tco_1456438 [Tanacetum coccineum]
MFKGLFELRLQAILQRVNPKPRVRDSKYFMDQMLLAKQDEAGVILTDEQNDFLFADASRIEEIEELRANICLMARIQPADQNSDDEPSYESAFVISLMYPNNSNIPIDSSKEMLIVASVKKIHMIYELCELKLLTCPPARNGYDEVQNNKDLSQKVQQQNMTLSSQIEMYKERNQVLENITKDNNYLK